MATILDLFCILDIHTSILFQFLTTRDACHLRGVCRKLRAFVTDFQWDDRTLESRVVARLGAVALWRACFPRAIACTLYQGDLIEFKCNYIVEDTDLALLSGVHYLHIAGCINVTDVGIAHIGVKYGLRELHINSCDKITDDAFTHLEGINILTMSGCNQSLITDNAFIHLNETCKLIMGGCTQITDKAFVHLKKVRKLGIRGCPQITDNAFIHLENVEILNMNGCTQITAKGLTYLHRIKFLFIKGCEITEVPEMPDCKIFRAV